MPITPGQTKVASPAPTVAPAEDVDNATAAANTLVNMVFPGESGLCWCLSGVTFSYSAAPTAGRVRVVQLTAGGADEVAVLDLDITASGLNQVWFSPAKRFPAGKGFRVQLDAAGASVVGKVNVLGKWKEVA